MKNKLVFAGLGIVAGWMWHRQSRPQPTSVKNSVAIITGGASGIGKATAHKFAKQGAIVIIADFDFQLDDKLRREFTVYNTPIHFIPCDITVASQRDQFIDEVTNHYEQVDILINNAGISVGGAFADVSPDAINKVINVNLIGTMHLTQSILQIMIAQNHGHIVNISSVNAIMPPPGEAIYSATKGGLNAFSDSLRRELGNTDIHISVVMPALTKTAMLNHVTEDELRQNQLLMTGIELDTPETVADAILKAVQYNQREVICGGQSMGLLSRLAQLRPSAMDWAFKHAIDTEEFMRALQKLDEADNSE